MFDFQWVNQEDEVSVKEKINKRNLFEPPTIIRKSSTTRGRFKCLSCKPPNCSHIEICENAVRCWKSTVKETTSGMLQVSRGCTTDLEQLSFCGPNTVLVNPQVQRNQNKRHTGGHYAIDCCSGNLCNNGSFPILPELYPEYARPMENYYEYILKLCLAILGPVFGLVLISAFVMIYMRQKYNKRLRNRRYSYDLESDDVVDSVIRTATAVGDSTLKEKMEHTTSSGSGSGLPLLVQRTLSRQISLVDSIGKGKYGSVWRAVWHGENVAVKIFKTIDGASWSRETEIYNTVLLRHTNLLGFLGSDVKSVGSYTYFWIVTDYHPLGSLYDHLNRTVLNCNQALTICYSIISGIEHIHTMIITGAGNIIRKPAIAHRDIKSKNILVKNNGECVIADFGLAITHVQQTNKIEFAKNPKQGTRRYMAPEILDDTINIKCFESFKRADIYSLSLVLWEVCRRTSSNGIAEEYQLPYFDCVCADPTFEDMRKVVAIEQQRPVLPNRWTSDPIMYEMMKVIRECWHPRSTVRLSALRIKKRIAKIYTLFK